MPRRKSRQRKKRNSAAKWMTMACLICAIANTNLAVDKYGRGRGGNGLVQPMFDTKCELALNHYSYSSASTDSMLKYSMLQCILLEANEYN